MKVLAHDRQSLTPDVETIIRQATSLFFRTSKRKTFELEDCEQYARQLALELRDKLAPMPEYNARKYLYRAITNNLVWVFAYAKHTGANNPKTLLYADEAFENVARRDGSNLIPSRLSRPFMREFILDELTRCSKRAFRLRQIVPLILQGRNPPEIAQELGILKTDVYHILGVFAARARAAAIARGIV